MFHLLLKKIFVFSPTLKLFGAETHVTAIRQAQKIDQQVNFGDLGLKNSFLINFHNLKHFQELLF
jgi:hypothetical protein